MSFKIYSHLRLDAFVSWAKQVQRERERERGVLFCRLNPVTYRAQQTKKEDIFTILPSSILMYIYMYIPRGPKHTLSRWLKCETHGGRVLKMQISKDHADRVLKNDLGYTNSILMFLYLYLNHPIIFDQAPTPILCSKAWQFELTHLIWGWVSKLQQNLRVQHVLCQKTFQPQNYASLIGIRFIAFSEFLPMTELCMTLLP